MTFGAWVKQERLARNLTQAQFAARICCAPISLRKIEAGRLRPSRQLAIVILKAVCAPFGERADLIRLARGDVYIERQGGN